MLHGKALADSEAQLTRPRAAAGSGVTSLVVCSARRASWDLDEGPVVNSLWPRANTLTRVLSLRVDSKIESWGGGARKPRWEPRDSGIFLQSRKFKRQRDEGAAENGSEFAAKFLNDNLMPAFYHTATTVSARSALEKWKAEGGVWEKQLPGRATPELRLAMLELQQNAFYRSRGRGFTVLPPDCFQSPPLTSKRLDSHRFHWTLIAFKARRHGFPSDLHSFLYTVTDLNKHSKDGCTFRTARRAKREFHKIYNTGSQSCPVYLGKELNYGAVVVPAVWYTVCSGAGP
ncbi:hypothetical protein RRG08_047775 [Elysia crispata]|uniref:Uncharacterized protein n=1 Tax=Elysia crispata TaxID=231223 RepID=A0AAE1D653_9GAST|nr:hypothetical protein RRG08_047775 [Elysia crispata]